MGYQMLSGGIPIRLNRDEVLSGEVPKFEELQRLNADREFSHLFPIMRKMTCLDPALRFASLSDAMAALENPEQHSLEVIEQSYRRCVNDEATADRFFDDFYRNLLNECPETKKIFASHGYSIDPKTGYGRGKRWQRQRRILSHAVLLCLKYFEDQYRNKLSEPHILTFNREKHSHVNISATAAAYDNFLKALLDTINEHDMQLTNSHRDYWRDLWTAVMRPGLDYMQS